MTQEMFVDWLQGALTNISSEWNERGNGFAATTKDNRLVLSHHDGKHTLRAEIIVTPIPERSSAYLMGVPSVDHNSADSVRSEQPWDELTAESLYVIIDSTWARAEERRKSHPMYR